MKLKKLLALALSGVLAVSMFAGCSTVSEKPENPTDEPDTPVSNYSTTFWNYLDAGQKKITFQANSNLDNALAAAVEHAGSLTVNGNYIATDFVKEVNTDSKPASLANVAISLADSTGAENDKLHITADDWTGMEATLNQLNAKGSYKNDDDVTAVALYVVDATVGVDAALEQAAGRLDEVIRDLDIVGTVTDQGVEYEYKYTGSVSVVSKSTDNLGGMSVNFIAVQIDRTTVQR